MRTSPETPLGVGDVDAFVNDVFEHDKTPGIQEQIAAADPNLKNLLVTGWREYAMAPRHTYDLLLPENRAAFLRDAARNQFEKQGQLGPALASVVIAQHFTEQRRPQHSTAEDLKEDPRSLDWLREKQAAHLITGRVLAKLGLMGDSDKEFTRAYSAARISKQITGRPDVYRAHADGAGSVLAYRSMGRLTLATGITLRNILESPLNLAGDKYYHGEETRRLGGKILEVAKRGFKAGINIGQLTVGETSGIFKKIL